MPGYEGRLELTWTNKNDCLLTDEAGGYTWLTPSDYRVAEVRLLDTVESVGVVAKARASDNLLIQGDALAALTSLAKLPEFKKQYLGRVKLAYIDPPFNTGQAFAHYDDALEHSVWLTMMRDRLVQIRSLLSDDGSVWVHLDDVEVHRCRDVLDEVFGASCFVTTVIWEKADSPRNSARQFSTDHDYILVYSATPDWKPKRLARTTVADSIYTNPDNDPRGPWLPGDPYANKPYSRGLYEITGPTGRTFKPPPGRYWRISEERLWEFDADGRIWWGPNGDARPSIKRYLSEVADLVPRTLWLRDEVGSNRTSKNEMRTLFSGDESFATPKPERLMQRILSIGSDPGDIVLDCFAGSGTTAAVAHKMKRRWITVERSAETIAEFTLPRLKRVVAGDDDGGITSNEVPSGDDLPEGVKTGQPRLAARVLDALVKADALTDVEGLDDTIMKALTKALRSVEKTETRKIWDGGGGFQYLRIAPSMFDEDEGIVYLADEMTNGHLAEATAAQLGFEYEPDPPFAGTKGRARLAVVDGVVNEGVVKLLVVALTERERLVVCGTGIDPEARGLLRELAPGSTMRKIPSALLERYRSSQVLKRSMSRSTDATGASADE